MNQATNGGMDIRVDLRSMETVGCPECGEKFFRQTFVIKRVPKLTVGAPVDVPVPVPMWMCENCSTLLTEFIPPGVGSIQEVLGEQPNTEKPKLEL